MVTIHSQYGGSGPLPARGLRNPRGDHKADGRTNRSAMLISLSGFASDLCRCGKD